MAVETPAPQPDPATAKILAEHSRQLEDHDAIIKALVQHLGALIARFDRIEKRLLIAAIVVFSGTKNGTDLLDALRQFLV